RVIGQTDTSLCAGAKFVKGVGLVCGLISLLFAVWSWLDGEVTVPLFFLLFVALGAYLILASGSTYMNKDSITYITSIGVYRLRWDEVREVEIDPFHGNLVFIGQNKVLSMLGPSCWSGKDREQMWRLLLAQIETRDIEIKEIMKVIWPSNKNTKIELKGQ